MNKLRLCFSKLGPAAYLSHLDTMRLFQRAFLRAGLTIRHTEGFHPHAYVTIAVPLPLGHESVCECLDFGMAPPYELLQVQQRLNRVLPAGVIVHSVYEVQRPVREIALIDNAITLIRESGFPAEAPEQARALFARPELYVEKKTKQGLLQQTDIRPRINIIGFDRPDDRTLICRCMLRAGNEYLNPVYVTAALTRYLPHLAPDEARYCRLALLDRDELEWH